MIEVLEIKSYDEFDTRFVFILSFRFLFNSGFTKIGNFQVLDCLFCKLNQKMKS